MYPNYPNQQPYPGQVPMDQPGYPPNSGQQGYPPILIQMPMIQPGYPQMSSFPHNPPMNQSMPIYPPNPNMGYPAMPGFQQPPIQQANHGQSSVVNNQPPIQQQNAPLGTAMATKVEVVQYRPTLMRMPDFDAANDAAILRKAMKGFGTDENALINVLCRRPCDQRMEIAKAFKTAYGKDLIENIKSETSGNFENVLVALLKPRIKYYCEELRCAMAGIGTNENTLIEILCGGLTNQEIHDISAEYTRFYVRNLEKDLKSETSFSFKRLLVSLSTGNRDESMITNIDSARKDAQCLIDAGIKKFGTDESEFNRILCLRSFAQLRLIAQEYEKLSGSTLERDIKKEFSGDVEKGMLSALRSAINRPLFFARCLNESIAGLGTRDRALIRLCVTRCEIDMMEIKEEYQRKYKESLRDAIKGNTSGHYKKALLALIGENC